jgi:hypothetical protein
MGILMDVIDELEAELHQSAVPVDVTDERRVLALMALASRAAMGDDAALATLAAVERLFARAGCQGSGAWRRSSRAMSQVPRSPARRRPLAAGPVLSRQSA